MPPRANNVIKIACTRDGKIPILLEFDQVVVVDAVAVAVVVAVGDDDDDVVVAGAVVVVAAVVDDDDDVVVVHEGKESVHSGACTHTLTH